MSSRNTMRRTPEWYAAHNAQRARDCAVADGHAPRPCAADAMPRVPERVTMPAILMAVRLHPKVAWAERMNTGGVWYEPEEEGGCRRYVRYGWTGMLDITGQMRDGRRLEVEAKASDGKPTPAQLAYIDLVRAHQGVAFWARSVDDVIRELATA